MKKATMPIPKIIEDLVHRYDEQRQSYLSDQYNETQVRREFLDPMFEALGWDMVNTAGYAEIYKDVVHEESLKIGTTTKAPDYGFRIGGQRKFFLEAKRPSIYLREDAKSALQLRRYAWSAKLPLSILTNFRELAVYDCRIRPENNDKASHARVMYFTCEEYSEKWNEIASIFSKNAILHGAFDKYAQTTKQKRGTAEVDDAFLLEIEGWRDLIAKNLALRNPSLTVRELNAAVQLTIDRIVFLRISEDRGIEPHGRLASLTKAKNVYAGLKEQFLKADARYNSGLFHFHRDSTAREGDADTLTLKLELDDSILKKVIQGLYYPESPYEFSVLPADILGQIYEQFLGKVITLHGRQATVEDKPEVKKAGGVYYTPTYVVQYIIEDTVKPLLHGKSIEQISGGNQKGKTSKRLTILDPACGSGSFLIQAYQLLLDWHLARYLEQGAQAHARGKTPKIHQTGTGEWRLTIAERKRILLTHIFGVDIDQQAVEVTKLSLLLKVLEGESGDAIARQMDMFHTRALPDLSSNIKCGNSLIGSDFYAKQPTLLSDDELMMHINAFDWHSQFRDVVSEGGFSAVIGNPPYRRELDYKYLMDEITATDFGRRYHSARMDLWYYFVHRSLDLLSSNGRLGFIVNGYWLSGTGAEKLISRLHKDNLVSELFYFGGLKVFKNVSGNHMILQLDKNRSATDLIKIKHCLPQGEKTAEPFVKGWSPVATTEKSTGEVFIDGKIDIEISDGAPEGTAPTLPLEQYAVIRQGIAENPSTINKKVSNRFDGSFKVGAGVFVVNDEERKSLHANAEERKLLKRYHDLRDIGRYWLSDTPATSLIYSTRQTAPDPAAIANIINHLKPYKRIMDARRETVNKSNKWWHLHWPREERIWSQDKIVSLQMAKRPSFAAAKGECYTTFSTNVIVPLVEGDDFLYSLTAILNSRYVVGWLQHHAKRRGVALEVNGNVLRRIPIPKALKGDTLTRRELAQLAVTRMETEREIRSEGSEQRKISLRGRIDILERQIDDRVDQMYGIRS